MALPLSYTTQEDVPELLRDYYVEQDDGTWRLDAEIPDSGPLKRALDQEKAQRLKATKELQDLKQSIADFKDLDPQKAREALEQIDKLEEERLRNEKQFEELAERKYARLLQEREAQAKAAEERALQAEGNFQSLRDRYTRTKIDDSLREAALAEGADPETLSFLLSQAREPWRLDDNDEPIAMDGDNIRFGSSEPGKPLTMREYMADMRKTAPKLFMTSSGGGASHSTHAVQNGAIMLTRAQAKNVRLYEAAKERAQREGRQVAIQD